MTQKFISAFTRAGQLSLSQINQFFPRNSYKMRFNIILPYALLFSKYSLSLCIQLSSSTYVTHALSIIFFSFHHLNNIRWAVKVMKFLITPSITVLFGHRFLVRPKYLHQNSILKHPYPTFLPQYERPSLTPTQASGKIIILYILNFMVFDGNQEDRRQKILNRMVAGIPGV